MKWTAAVLPLSWLLAATPPAAGNAASTGLVAFEIKGDAVDRPLGGLKGVAERGGKIIADRRSGNCLICHAVPAIAEPFQGRIGPSLAGVAKRLSVGQMRLRLIDLSRLKPNTLMPPYYRTENLTDVAPAYQGKPILDAQQIEDVLAFLARQTEPK